MCRPVVPDELVSAETLALRNRAWVWKPRPVDPEAALRRRRAAGLAPDGWEGPANVWTLHHGEVTRGADLESDGRLRVGADKGDTRDLAMVALPDGSVVRDGVVYHVPTEQDDDIVVLLRTHSPARGNWGARFPKAARIVARGFHSYGSAGRAGGGDEYLVVLPAGETIAVEWTGPRGFGLNKIRVENRGGSLVTE